MLYSEGNGVEQDDEEAFELLSKAAKLGHSRAQIKLADFLFEGRGCIKSATGALYWYDKAAEQGSSAAMFALGDFYENGIGCVVDIIKAVEYYEMSASRGDVSASERLIGLVANSTLLDNILTFGYAARAA